MSAAEFWRCHVCGVEANGSPDDLAAHQDTVRHHWRSIDVIREQIAYHRESISTLEKDIDAHAKAALAVVERMKAGSS